MKLYYLNLHHGNNWILEPGGGEFSYNIRNKNFHILFQNNRNRFGVKIDKGSEIRIPPSGNYSDDKVELLTTAKNLDTHDYMQVTHTIRNKKQTILKVDIGLNLDITIYDGTYCDGDYGYKNISGTKGVFIYNDAVNFSFIFRGSSYATDVDNLATVSSIERFLPNSYSTNQKFISKQ